MEDAGEETPTNGGLYVAIHYLFCCPDRSTGTRPNALLLIGTPISHLPTARIFAYANHFDAEPVALEWIDDTSCVLVFPSVNACKTAYLALLKSSDEMGAEDADSLSTAKPIPVTLWPPEDRINKTLGVSEGLKGELRMRIARAEDVKKRGARNASEFYKKHGMDAGKDPNAHAIGRVVVSVETKKRRRGVDSADEEETRKQLDAELDHFLAENEDASPVVSLQERLKPKQSRRLSDSASESGFETGMRSDHLVESASWGRRSGSPPSKMRSDYMDSRGRSLLERTSVMRAHPDDFDFEGQKKEHEKDWDKYRRHHRRWRGWEREATKEDRPVRPLPRRGRNGERSERGKDQPRKTQQELDDELEAFLKERN